MRVVVVGAGVVGLACAHELLQDGHDVTVIDGGAAGQSASHGNAAKVATAESGPVPAPGMVVQGVKWMLRSDSPLYVRPSLAPSFVRFMLSMARHCTASAFRRGLEANLRLAQSAGDLFDEWRAAGLSFEMHQRGVLLAYEDARTFEDRLRLQGIFEAHDAHAEILVGGRVQEVEPALSDRLTRGLYYPADRQIHPDSLTAALVGAVTGQGGTLHEHLTVRGFDLDHRGVTAVRTDDGGRHPCDGVVLAAGVWTSALAQRLGVRLPIQPGKGYSLDFSPSPVQLRTSLTLEDAHVAVTPLDGFVRVGGTMEFSGFDQSRNAVRIAAVERAAIEGLRDFGPERPHREAWAGLRPMTPDGLPVIGRLTDGLNVWVASGHGMLGLTLAPTTAREIRGLLRGDATPDPAMSPRRFARRGLPVRPRRGPTARPDFNNPKNADNLR